MCEASDSVPRYITSPHTWYSYLHFKERLAKVDTLRWCLHHHFFFVTKMPSSRQRSSANAIPTVSLNEKILKECNDLYTEKEKGKNAWSSLLVVWRGICKQWFLLLGWFILSGLVRIASGLGLDLLAPRKKITVLLLGNHSAGKSSFINWWGYCLA